MKFYIIFLFIFALFLNGCGFYKPVDVRKVPVNAKERVKKNIEEGRGVRFNKKAKGGVFDFASSNEMWRATLEVLDFVSFTNASYSGGIVITDWISGTTLNNEGDKDIKITVKFLSNEIRADGLEVILHERVCSSNSKDNCKISKIKSSIESEIKLAILRKASEIQQGTYAKNAEEYRKKYGERKVGNFGQEKKE